MDYQNNEIPLVVSKQKKLAYVLAAILCPFYVFVVLVAFYTLAARVNSIIMGLVLLSLFVLACYLYYLIAGIVHTIKFYKDRIEKTFPLVPFVKLTYRYADNDKAVIRPMSLLVFSLVLCKANKEKKVIANLLSYKNFEEMLAAIPILEKDTNGNLAMAEKIFNTLLKT